MSEDNNDNLFSLGGFLLFGLASAVFLYFGKDWSPYVMSANWTLLIGGILVYLSSLYPYWLSKYKMPQAQADGCHGSFQHNESPQRVKDFYLKVDSLNPKKPIVVHFDWLVYGLGASLFPVPIKGKDCVLIVPELQMETRSKNHHSSTQVFLTPLDKLSPALQNFLNLYSSNYNLKQIFIGTRSFSFKPKDFEDANKDLMIGQLNSQVSTLSKMLSGDFSGFEKVKNLVDKLSPKADFLTRVYTQLQTPQNAPAS